LVAPPSALASSEPRTTRRDGKAVVALLVIAPP
jgi:hypothetical protein